MSSYGDYEFEVRTSSGTMTGTIRKKPDSTSFYIVMTVLVGLLCVGCVSWLNTGSIFGTGEPEKPPEVYESYRGVWTAKGKLPGEKEETTIRVSVPTDTARESRIEFSNPQCSVRLKVRATYDFATYFDVKGEPQGKPKWCADIFRASLDGDYVGEGDGEKRSDKVALDVDSGDQMIVDEWPVKRLQETFKPTPSPSPKDLNKLPKSFEGTWTGGPVNSKVHDDKRPHYYVVLKLTGGQVGHQVGTISYPELGCSGTVSLEDNRTNTSTQVNLEEQLKSDPKALCTDGETMIPQHIELGMNKDETLAFESVQVNADPDSKPGATVTLRRK